MSELARLPRRPPAPVAEPRLAEGRVTAEGSVEDHSTGAVLALRRAVSCLVEPIAGDRVLLACGADGEAYVLAVLSRPGTEAVRIGPGAERALTVAAGQLRIEAGESLVVDTPQAVVRLTGLALFGDTVAATFRRVGLVAGLVESTFERVMQRVRDSVRNVENVDAVTARDIVYQAENLLSARGDQAVVSARREMRIDGERIHMG